MPAEKRLGLHDSQGGSPVEPPPKPDQNETGHVRRTPGFAMAFLVEGELLTQEEILRGKDSRRAHTEPEEAHHITQECQQRASDMQHMVEQARASCHDQGVLL